MSKLFISCMGKSACRENDTHCMTCGRGLEEIYATRELIETLARYAQSMGYENSEVFFEYIATKAAKKLKYLKSQPAVASNKSYEYH